MVKFTTEKTMNNSGVFGKAYKRKSLVFKKYIAPQVMFAKLHLNKPQDFWDNVL